MIFCLLLKNVLTFKDSLENLYLLPPYVDGKGISKIANFVGEYSILSHGSDQHIKLGYMSPNTAGALVYRTQMGVEKFQMDIKMNIDNLEDSQENTGILIFFKDSDNVEIGPFYGINPEYEFAIALDIKHGMDVVVKVFSKTKLENSVSFSLYDGDDVIIKIQQGDKLRVDVDVFDEEVNVYDNEKFFIKKNLFMGVSASNGSRSEGSFSIRSIEPSVLKVIPKIFERGERERSSKLVWLVFLVSGGSIFYYLYTKQAQKKD